MQHEEFKVKVNLKSDRPVNFLPYSWTSGRMFSRRFMGLVKVVFFNNSWGHACKINMKTLLRRAGLSPYEIFENPVPYCYLSFGFTNLPVSGQTPLISSEWLLPFLFAPQSAEGRGQIHILHIIQAQNRYTLNQPTRKYWM